MTKVNIISGFLGAGKTTLIKKLLKEVYADEQVVLIENEFGEIGIDGGFLQDAGVEVTEMNSGCICCSLSGDFTAALQKVLDEFHPDRIIIEPSGVGKLSDVKRAVINTENDELQLCSSCTVVDVMKCAMYQKNFGEFFNNQIEHADALILSRTQHADERKLQESAALLKKLNEKVPLVTTPWDELEGSVIAKAMEHQSDLSRELMEEEEICEVCGHHHHHHDHEHHNHHHHHEEACGCHHHHHHDHDADEVFTSWGSETVRIYDKDELTAIAAALADSEQYGQILRAKGMVKGHDTWYYFDVTPQEYEIREGQPSYTGRYCVIGSKLKEEALARLFDGEKETTETAQENWSIEVE